MEIIKSLKIECANEKCASKEFFEVGTTARIAYDEEAEIWRGFVLDAESVSVRYYECCYCGALVRAEVEDLLKEVEIW